MRLFSYLFARKVASQSRSIVKKTEAEQIQKAFEKVMETLNQFKRTAYLPEVELHPQTFSSVSKFGGYPYLRHEKDWPVCSNCQNHMQLFLQLNMETLPINKEEGLIQLFYCTNDEPCCSDDLEAYFPFSKAVVCRRIEVLEDSAQIKPNLEEVFTEKHIISWEAIDDYPHYEEYEALGIQLDIPDEVDELMYVKELGLPVGGDKLFGWPLWVQSVEYPFDRKTKTQMELLFQIDSEVNLPYMFGDAGIGHLTQSPDDKGELGFGWACT